LRPTTSKRLGWEEFCVFFTKFSSYVCNKDRNSLCVCLLYFFQNFIKWSSWGSRYTTDMKIKINKEIRRADFINLDCNGNHYRFKNVRMRKNVRRDQSALPRRIKVSFELWTFLRIRTFLNLVWIPQKKNNKI